MTTLLIGLLEGVGLFAVVLTAGIVAVLVYLRGRRTGTVTVAKAEAKRENAKAEAVLERIRTVVATEKAKRKKLEETHATEKAALDATPDADLLARMHDELNRD